MPNPTISATLDKASYAPGEQMTLTVQYADADNWTRVDTIVITGTDQNGNAAVATIETTVTSEDEVLLTIEDTSGRTWSKFSDDGSTAVYTSTA